MEQSPSALWLLPERATPFCPLARRRSDGLAPGYHPQGNVLDTHDKLNSLFAEPTAAAFDKKAYKNPLSCD